MTSLDLSVFNRTATDAGTSLDDRPGRDGRIGLIIAGIFFLGFGSFAAFAPLRSAVYARGQVVVADHRQAVQHPEGGIVTHLLVRNDQHVARDEVLLEIANTESSSAVDALTSTVRGLQARRARLIAERDRLIALVAPAEFASLEGDAARLARQAMDEQARLFRERQQARRAEEIVLSQRIVQLKAQKVGIEAQKSATLEQLRIVDEEIIVQEQLLKKGLTLAPRLRALERDKARLLGEEGEHLASLERTDEAIREAQLTQRSADQTFRSKVAEELQDTDARLGELVPQLAAARVRLERSQVRAPAAGRVVGLSVFTEGGVIAAGQQLMEIIPDEGGYIVEARADPNDADDLMPGLKAEVRFSGLPARETPLLAGKVGSISADRLVDQRTGEAYYRLEVVVGPEELSKLRDLPDGPGRVRPGIPAEIIIPLRDRTLISYMVDPLITPLWRSFIEH